MTKICAIHQPNFFPWLGYFEKINQSDAFILLNDVDIMLGSSSSITHRTRINTANGPAWLTIPLIKGDSKVIGELKIDNAFNWQEKHLKSIFLSYKKSTNFDLIYPLLEAFYSQKFELLQDINVASIHFICNQLGIKKELFNSSELLIEDFDRNDKLIELCKKVGANTYLSGNGARTYMDLDLFKSKGIDVNFIKYNNLEYEQIHGEFIPGLSALDYLFNANFQEWK